jgi:hypothetical protein
MNGMEWNIIHRSTHFDLSKCGFKIVGSGFGALYMCLSFLHSTMMDDWTVGPLTVVFIKSAKKTRTSKRFQELLGESKRQEKDF